MSVIVLTTQIVIECLHCGHAALLHEDGLRKYGEEPGASLVSLSKRLICKECKSGSVRAYRRIDNEAPLSPQLTGGDVSPKRA
jgi:RNase P subunit RPR2